MNPRDKSAADDFERTFQTLVNDMGSSGPPVLDQTLDWLKKVIVANVPNGKQIRGRFIAELYRLMAAKHVKLEAVIAENLELARVLGWCVEMLHTVAIIIDDIMDGSSTRRGQLCWYKRVGLSACNDAKLIETQIFLILRKYFAGKRYYSELVDLMHEMTRLTSYGQCIDSSTYPKISLEELNRTRYDTIVKYKTSLYTFVLPLKLVLLLLDIDSDDRPNADLMENMLLKMGRLFQMQDDYLDCFGEPELTGKAGTDIADGKCCWPIVAALSVADGRQRKTLSECYGVRDESAVERVKQVYREMGLAVVYREEEEKLYRSLRDDILQFGETNAFDGNFFARVLARLYKRSV